jgi:hypothetical protein
MVIAGRPTKAGLSISYQVKRAGDHPFDVIGQAGQDHGVVAAPEALHVPLDRLFVFRHCSRRGLLLLVVGSGAMRPSSPRAGVRPLDLCNIDLLHAQ